MANQINQLRFFGFQNWKVFQNEQLFHFANLTILVGPNNSGKSSLVQAIKFAAIIFKDLKAIKNIKDFNVRNYSNNPLRNIIQISLPDNLEHLTSFLNLINLKNESKEFSFMLCIDNVLFPAELLFIKFIYSTESLDPRVAILKQITIKTSNDEPILKINVINKGLLFQSKEIYYSFSVIHNYSLLKKYFERGEQIQSLINEIKSIRDDFYLNNENLLSKSPITDAIIDKEMKNEKPAEFKKILALKKQLANKYSIRDKQINLWEKINFTEELFFEYAHFTKKASEFKKVAEKNINEAFSKRGGEWFEHFKQNFNNLAKEIERVILNYLWEKEESIGTFIRANEGENFFDGHNVHGGHDGVNIIYIREKSEIFNIVVEKLTVESNITDIESIKYFFRLGVMLRPEQKRIDGWYNNIESTSFKKIANFENLYFTSYKAKKLSSFYTLRQNELGLDERIFQVLAKGNNTISNDVFSFLNHYLKVFNIGDRLHIVPLNPINAVLFEVEKNNIKQNIAALGYGSTNILILLLSILSIASKNEIESTDMFEVFGFKREETLIYDNAVLFLEEPEANLHPAVQSKLADLLVEANKKFNIQFVVETHSEYLIRKLQYIISNNYSKQKRTYLPQLQTEDVAIYYFNDPDKIPEGRKQVYKIQIDKSGRLTDTFEEGFFDVSGELEFLLYTNEN